MLSFGQRCQETFYKNASDWNRVKGRREETILTKKEIGRRGEEIAAEFLERKGLQIVERNFHSRWGELDLIAVKINESDYENEMYFDETAEGMNADATMGQGNGVHFVEVKTRTGSEYGTPGAAVTYTKQQKLRKTALVWLQEQEQYYSDLCFDVIEVWVVGKTAKIRWLQSCF
ncbi:MAG: YraN family protein [Acidaminococcaceae bacterium]|nr:YraN family protein [Acidaminococcaceae bacterium]